MAPLSEEIVVVSGLPRSGTSLMMAMLGAGGVPLLTDERRDADEDNPRGYFEYEPVKDSERDVGWVAGARGRAVKVISELLHHLPDTETYRVVFMLRRIGEVLASQGRMLRRRGEPETAGPPDEEMEGILLRHLDRTLGWVGEQPGFELLPVSYNDLVAKPRPHADRIADFLGRDLDRAAMAAVVDPALYRRRTEG